MKKRKLSELSIAIYSLIICSIIVIFLTLIFFEYNNEFVQNVTVEAHGMLMDLAVIGVLSLWLNNKVRQRDINRSYLEQLDDFRFWKSAEASFRIAGLIKRLNRNGESRIDINQCFICGVRLESLLLQNANCFQVNMSGSTLKKVEFNNCKLKGSSFNHVAATSLKFHKCFMRIVCFQSVNMPGVEFKDCDLVRADFKDAFLKSSVFDNTDLENVSFEGADLENANFIKAKNIRIEQLIKASSLKSVKLDDKLLQEMKIKHPKRIKQYTDRNGKSYIKIL